MRYAEDDIRAGADGGVQPVGDLAVGVPRRLRATMSTALQAMVAAERGTGR